MRYKLFICKPEDRVSWPVSRALREYVADGSTRVRRRDVFAEFDVRGMMKLLCVASGEAAGFSPLFRCRRLDGLPLLMVATEYVKAQAAVDAIAACVESRGLVLIDGEMDCRVGIKKRERESFVAARMAYQRLKTALVNNAALAPGHCSMALYFSLGQCFSLYPEGMIDTAIMVLRGNIADAVASVDVALRSALSGNEVLYCRDGCFVVESRSDGYKIRFVIEGSGKSAQYTGWIERGKVRLEMLRRMCLYQALPAIMKSGCGEVGYVRSRLYFGENFATRGPARNPADRFVDSYKISQRLKKSGLDIIYGRHPNRHGSEFLFYVDDGHEQGWDSWKASSFSGMTEEQAAPLLAVFESVIPYYYEYYYDKFHFRKEEAIEILERVKTVRRQIIDDLLGPELGKITKRLQNSEFAWQYPDGKRAARFDDEEKREILRQNRFRITALLDFFSWWLAEQRNNPKRQFDGFYVEGP